MEQYRNPRGFCTDQALANGGAQVVDSHLAGIDDQRLAPHGLVPLKQVLDDAANAVAAHLCLAAVGVEHAHPSIALVSGKDG